MNRICTQKHWSLFLSTGGFMQVMLTGTVLFVESADAHGYIDSPASRAYQCQQGQNSDCGPVQYEPQSEEGPGSFPQSGPPDGQITGGGVFPDLDVQTADRWAKVTVNGGKNTFRWH